MDNQKLYSFVEVADMLSIPKAVLKKWENNGKLIPIYNQNGDFVGYDEEKLEQFFEFKNMQSSSWKEETIITPFRKYTSVELFAGAGGLALGLEQAGFKTLLLNEIDKDACETLRKNRPDWNVLQCNVSTIDFSFLCGGVDFLSGGFPCQAFSYAGNKRGFEDTRGTLFFEFARAIKEIQPRVFMVENVKGLLSHDNGTTFNIIKTVLGGLGYTIIEPRVLKAIFYKVPQKRERLFLIGIRKDLAGMAEFKWPSPYRRIMKLKDALFKGELYESDVPESAGQAYPQRKKEILSYVPQGGYWRDLPIDLQKEYMKKSFYLGGGKTGMARRLSLEEPSLTLTCSPSQKQTERCHPIETRPLTIREYARIQTFPDNWEFTGSISSIYKQIGNAVPVNLAAAVSRSLIRFLNLLEKKNPILEIKNIYLESQPSQLYLALNDKVAQYQKSMNL